MINLHAYENILGRGLDLLNTKFQAIFILLDPIRSYTGRKWTRNFGCRRWSSTPKSVCWWYKSKQRLCSNCCGMCHITCVSCSAFLEAEIESAINQSLPIPPTSHKVLGTNKALKGFPNSCICYIKRPCLNFGLYPVLIACLQLEIDSGKSSCYFWKVKSAYSLQIV